MKSLVCLLRWKLEKYGQEGRMAGTTCCRALYTGIKHLDYERLKVYVRGSSVAQSYPTLCDLIDCGTPGLPVHHQLPEFTETHVHWVGDAIQPSHPLSFPSPPAFNLPQCQGLFQWVTSGGQSIGVSTSAPVLPVNIQVWFPLGWTSWISLQSKGLSRVFSNTTVQKHQFFGAQLSL